MKALFAFLALLLSANAAVSRRQQEVQAVQPPIHFSRYLNQNNRNDITTQPDPPPKNETARMARYIVHYSGKVYYTGCPKRHYYHHKKWGKIVHQSRNVYKTKGA